jgi:microcystin-dependent protein
VSEPFIGQLLVVAFPWAPDGWAACQGQVLGVQQNQALYALIGNTFGGAVPNTFGVPNLAGRTVIGMGADTSGNQYPLGQANTSLPSFGLANLPSHSHPALFTAAAGAAPTAVTLQGTLDVPLSVPLSGSLGATSAGGGNNTPTAGEKLGAASVQVYVPSGGTAVPLTTLNLQGKLTGTPASPLVANVTMPPPAGSVTLGQTGTAGSTNLPAAPYLVQTVAIATQGFFPTRP